MSTPALANRIRHVRGDRMSLRSPVNMTVALSDVDTNMRLTKMEGRAVSYVTLATRFWHRLHVGEGSLDKSIKEAARALPLLLFHDDAAFPIGNAHEWRSQSGDGLWGVWDIDEHPDAQRAARLAKDGRMTGLSIRMEILQSYWDEPADEWSLDDVSTWEIRHVSEARLLETSLLPVPAMADAHVTTVLGHAGGTPELDRWRSWRANLA